MSLIKMNSKNSSPTYGDCDNPNDICFREEGNTECCL